MNASLRMTHAVVIGCAMFSAPTMRAQSAAPAPSAAIRLNQIGFLPGAPKRAIVVAPNATDFVVVGAQRGDTVLRGTLSAAKPSGMSGEAGVRQAEFSRLTRAGQYRLVVPGVGESFAFEIGTRNLRELSRDALKAFYFQRTAVPLLPRHAGKWARAAGHPDTSVIVHSSAASAGRPAGSRISSSLGWYDAGDYNKYIVNSGISTYTLLLIAEQFPAYASALRTNIPESDNPLPDVLDEALFNVRWMRTMQDPSDGGVYNKLTNPEFDAFVMPHEAVKDRYVVQKGTSATLNFAAVMAQASRIVRRYPRQLPGLADSLTAEALAAWRWARLHPESLYVQDKMNETHTPRVVTGGYGDSRMADERRWAAVELALTTRQDSFLVAVPPVTAAPATVPTWNEVGTLALISLVEHRRSAPRSVDTAAVSAKLLQLATSLRAVTDTTAYGVAMGTRSDFAWGSNAVASNQGMVLVQAYRLTRDTSFLRAALGNLDYVMGRNATGYSFVTGHGVKTPMFPHHRPSGADTVVAPVPGMLVGGPNPSQQDKCEGYPSKLPALSFSDVQCSYASNEIAINWNAPLAYLAAAIDATYAARVSSRR